MKYVYPNIITCVKVLLSKDVLYFVCSNSNTIYLFLGTCWSFIYRVYPLFLLRLRGIQDLLVQVLLSFHLNAYEYSTNHCISHTVNDKILEDRYINKGTHQ